MKTLEDFEKFSKNNPIRIVIKNALECKHVFKSLNLNTWYQQAEICENKNFEVAKNSVIRKEVLEFAQNMEKKLKENDHKSHWNLMEIECLLIRLQSELIELEKDIKKNIKGNVIVEECADVANFAMMIADKYRSKTMSPEVKPTKEEKGVF